MKRAQYQIITTVFVIIVLLIAVFTLTYANSARVMLENKVATTSLKSEVVTQLKGQFYTCYSFPLDPENKKCQVKRGEEINDLKGYIIETTDYGACETAIVEQQPPVIEPGLYGVRYVYAMPIKQGSKTCLGKLTLLV